MAENSYHRLINGKYSRWEQDGRTLYVAGDIMENLTDGELAGLKGKVEKVSVGGIKVVAAESQVQVQAADTDSAVVIDSAKESVGSSLSEWEPLPDELLADILIKSVSEAESAIKAITHADTLSRLRKLEANGKQRGGIMKVIKARERELQAEG